MPVYHDSALSPRRRLSDNLVPEKQAQAATPVLPGSLDSDVELLNVTAVDVRCLINANPAIGDTVRFDVQWNRGRPISVSGIVHWKELRRTRYEIGLYLPAGLPAGMPDLRTSGLRKSNRYRCRQTGVCCRLQTHRRTQATVVNYCYDGFAMQTDTFCGVDDVINFEWICERSPQRIIGQVLWQIEQEHGILLGCQTDAGVGYRLAGLSVSPTGDRVRL